MQAAREMSVTNAQNPSKVLATKEQTSGIMTPEREPKGGQSASAQGVTPALLEVDAITIQFGGVVALDGVRFEVASGQICGLIGPNGAGKTTLFNCISRLYDPHSGSIRFAGRPLGGVPKHEIAALGIARTFQYFALFGTMSVRQNVMVGSMDRSRRVSGERVRGALARREEKKIAERADALIEEFGLAKVAGRMVAELPFGTKKRVELARALASEPKLLLLDEPAAGLNHEEVDALGGRDPIDPRSAGRQRAACRASHEFWSCAFPIRSWRSISAV